MRQQVVTVKEMQVESFALPSDHVLSHAMAAVADVAKLIQYEINSIPAHVNYVKICIEFA